MLAAQPLKVNYFQDCTRCFCAKWNHLMGCPDKNSNFGKISAILMYELRRVSTRQTRWPLNRSSAYFDQQLFAKKNISVKLAILTFLDLCTLSY